MTRSDWIRYAAVTIPATIAAAIVAATLGPVGAVLYCLLLLASVNTRHLFREDRIDLLDRLRKALHR